MSKLSLYFILLCFTITYVNCTGICDQVSPDVAEKVYLKLFKGFVRQYHNSTVLTTVTNRLTNLDTIAKAIENKGTILYIHGFIEDGNVENVQVVPRAYLNRGDVNVILVDWGEIAININYIYVSSQVPAIGKALAESLEKLSKVINLNTVHVIGHSLGAHIAGHMGRHMNVTLSRITGLDPAFPLFYPSTCHIRPNDAEIVVILHTDGGVFGTPTNTGTVDFYANMGISLQPGCPIIIGSVCSHQRSTRLFAESVLNPKAFPAYKCSEDITNTREESQVYFGDSTPKNIYGAYCFFTNAQPPYGRT
ncbi:lipase member H [Calliopsis andreniformis]|uniref:lipase member H n=1 Tax=Calliopsis andreniformis TaxID=337506 RepID=UPI003FCDD144